MEVPRGPIDLRTTFDQDVMLVNSSGELLPINEYGILTQSLQMGGSYFAVNKLKSKLTCRFIERKFDDFFFFFFIQQVPRST